jgi:hypothetical protein
MPRHATLLLMALMLALPLAFAQAEVIKRVNPDGSITYIVPQRAPSPAVVEPGPCDPSANTPTTFAQAQDAYNTVLQRLQAAPDNVQCRQQLVRLGRLQAELERASGRATVYDETAIANDLNAISGGSATVPGPGAPR